MVFMQEMARVFENPDDYDIIANDHCGCALIIK
jgi:hypothetical protein